MIDNTDTRYKINYYNNIIYRTNLIITALFRIYLAEANIIPKPVELKKDFFPLFNQQYPLIWQIKAVFQLKMIIRKIIVPAVMVWIR